MADSRGVLSREITARRLIAAREAAGLKQADVARRFAERGLPGDQAGRLERSQMDLQVKQLEIWSNVTGFPAAWFTDVDLRALFSAPEEAAVLRAQLVALEASLVEQIAETGELRTDLEDVRKRLERVERKAGGLTN